MFGKKNIENSIELFDAGQMVCSQCGKLVSFNDQQPLQIMPCPECEKGYNFVPLHIDRFWLFAPLGGGGMGSVYKAFIEDEEDLFAAVKVLPRDKKTDPVLIAGLQAESSIIAELGNSECIIGSLGAGFADDEYFLATQYCEGERLDKRIQRLRRLPELEVLLIGLRLLQAETHVYNQGFLFRDMKPENVIVNDEGAFLFDYGICMRVEDAWTEQSDMVSGSPIYWPPERVTGDVEMCSSEVYSLGMVLYHSLNGEPYFHAREIETMARKHVRTVRLSDFDQKMKKIRPDLAQVIAHMIAREPAERYQSFAEVETELLNIFRSRLEELN